MNAQNAPQFLPLVQALAEGKTIQEDIVPDEWEDVLNPTFLNSVERYRVKPEPRTFNVWVCVDKYENWQAGDLRCDDHPPTEFRKYWERITVQEVLK